MRDRSNADNYRLISILPLVSKIFQKIYKPSTLGSLDSSSFIRSNLFGFRRALSTKHAPHSTFPSSFIKILAWAMFVQDFS